MKKLIIGAVAMAIGLVAQAGSFNWSYTGTASEKNDGYHVYVILGTTASEAAWKNAADVLADSVSDSVVKTSGKSYKAYALASDDAIASYDQKAIFVLVNGADGDQYKITDAMTIGEAYVMIGTDTGKGAFPVTFSGDWKKFGGSPEPIPEPTSAMLILIGVAGLALKRKLV